MADIFLSYASEDRDRLTHLVEGLRVYGHRVWWDRNIPGGADFATEIEKQIKAADAVLVAWSAHSVVSTWVRDEAAMARDADRLVPVLLEEVAVPLGFRQFHVIDLADWTGDPGAAEFSEVLSALERAGASTAGGEAAPAWSSTRRTLQALHGNRTALAAGLIALVFAATTGWLWQRTLEPSGVVAAHLEITLPDGLAVPLDTEHPVLALSPDGSLLVLVAERDGERQLYKRHLADAAIQAIEGTQGAASPFFSPDGQWIAFYVGNMIRRVSSGTGAPVDLQAAIGIGVNRGTAWIDANTLVLSGSADAALEFASIIEGRPGAMSTLTPASKRSVAAAWPAPLPTGDVLFTESAGAARGEEPRVMLLRRATGTVHSLVPGATSPRYAADGHLLFVRRGQLHTTRFDVAQGAAVGTERALPARVVIESFGAAQYAVGGAGTLAYLQGGPVSTQYQLVWVDPDGHAEGVYDDSRALRDIRLSPDGSQLALTVGDGSNWDVWVLDLHRGSLRRVTSHPDEDFGPVWSPDGRDLVMSSEIGQDRGDMGPAMAWTRGPSEGLEQLLLSPGFGNWEMPMAWSPDSRWIAYLRVLNGDRGSSDIMLYPVDGQGEPRPWLETIEVHENGVRFSPEGKWVTYVSDETGAAEVYVRPFPDADRTIAISTGGGSEPVWSRDGRSLFYRRGDAMMVVDLSYGDELTAGVPRELFRGRYLRTAWGAGNASYDVAPDGRFLMIRRTADTTSRTIQVVLNWPAAWLSES